MRENEIVLWRGSAAAAARIWAAPEGRPRLPLISWTCVGDAECNLGSFAHDDSFGQGDETIVSPPLFFVSKKS